MEMQLGPHATISVSTDNIVNNKLLIAVVAFTGRPPCMTYAERRSYDTMKAAALAAIADQLHAVPMVVEPAIPQGWPDRASVPQRLRFRPEGEARTR